MRPIKALAGFRRASWLFVLTAALVALLGAQMTPSLASAASTSSDQPQLLDVATPSASSNLTGSTGGAYHYFRVAYQGSNSPVLFSLTYQSPWGAGSNLVGFNLYGPNDLSLPGKVIGTSENSTTVQYTLASGAAMSILVQVYNYSDGGSIAYTLSVSGLSGGSSSTVVGQNNTTPDQSAPVSTINASLGGEIVGTLAGSFQYYTLQYPGGDTPLTITMNAWPGYSGSGQPVGFNVYRALPSGSVKLVATGSVSGQDNNSTTISATVSGRSAATYQLQVYNYRDGTRVNYGITTTGLAGSAPAVSGNDDSGRAVVLNSARQGATASFSGNRGGAFNYYLVSYPGSNSALAISITYGDRNGVTPSALGFNVYDGSTLIATINPIDDGDNAWSGVWNYKGTDAKTFGIQVFNYSDGATATYTIYQVGSN